jgi:hypothetical protein
LKIGDFQEKQFGPECWKYKNDWDYEELQNWESYENKQLWSDLRQTREFACTD